MLEVIDTLSQSARQALKKFLDQEPEDCLNAWKNLPLPAFNDVDGEYECHFLPKYNEIYRAWIAAGLANVNSPSGLWLGKAYRPLGQVTGEGYNIWRMPDGRVERRVRYGTHIGTSRVDGRLALVMTYASFNRTANVGGFGVAWKVDTIDEIRLLEDGVLVGVATSKLESFADPARAVARRVYESYGLRVKENCEPTDRTPPLPAMFVLSGPVRPWVGVDDPAVENV